jgi:uncharacterized membrane protein YdfJ with MMPL/SSD domain
MHQVTSKTRDRLIFSAIIFVLVIAMITVIACISPVTLMAVLVILTGLKLGDFIVSIAERLVDWLHETW